MRVKEERKKKEKNRPHSPALCVVYFIIFCLFQIHRPLRVRRKKRRKYARDVQAKLVVSWFSFIHVIEEEQQQQHQLRVSEQKSTNASLLLISICYTVNLITVAINVTVKMLSFFLHSICSGRCGRGWKTWSRWS